jgi:histidinol dehydrogenase
MTTANSLSLRFSGRIADLSDDDRTALLDRTTSTNEAIRNGTSAIIAEVRRRGDAALKELAARFDGVKLSSLEVSRDDRRRALDAIDPALRSAMERSAMNIATVHRSQLPTESACAPEIGITIARRPTPIARAGIYAPGGRAAYPSSVLMAAVPARVADVNEVIVCSPPDASGKPSPHVLAAAEIAGVDRVFAIGGAGAIAAMAFGTETVPRVDRIVGPGNAYVAEAKLQLCGVAGIDSPAGPSELLVIADETANPAAVAGELLAQAEHDPSACVVAVAIGPACAERIGDALRCAADTQPRRAIIADALAFAGGLLVADDVDEAVAFANSYAPEHLLLTVDDPASLLPGLRNAGTIFLGAAASVSFGDYMTGANHVLPTGGLARSYSGLCVLDFFRWTTIQMVTPAAARSLAGPVALFADAEGLPGHAAAARAAGEVR